MAVPRMWTLLLGVIFGLLASSELGTIQVNERTCSFAGVFRAEGPGRHSLTFEMAQNVCQQLQTTMATLEQIEEAYNQTMESCRNGWTSNMSIAILRHKSHDNCANNSVGLIINSRVTPEERYDVYCYDEEDGPGRNCTKHFKLRPTKKPTTAAHTMAKEPETSTNMEGIHTEDFESSTLSTIFDTTELDTTPVLRTQIPVEKKGDHTTVSVSMQSTAETTQKKPNKEDAETNSRKPNDKDGMPEDDKQKDNHSSNWLVILLVILAVLLILLICVVAAKRKSLCGRKKTLMITSKDGGEGNGAAASASSSHNQEREQEMVTLMSTDKVQENGNTEEFTVIALEGSSDKDQLA